MFLFPYSCAGFTFTQVELDYLLISVHYVTRHQRKARVQIHVGVFYSALAHKAITESAKEDGSSLLSSSYILYIVYIVYKEVLSQSNTSVAVNSPQITESLKPPFSPHD